MQLQITGQLQARALGDGSVAAASLCRGPAWPVATQRPPGNAQRTTQTGGSSRRHFAQAQRARHTLVFVALSTAPPHRSPDLAAEPAGTAECLTPICDPDEHLRGARRRSVVELLLGRGRLGGTTRGFDHPAPLGATLLKREVPPASAGLRAASHGLATLPSVVQDEVSECRVCGGSVRGVEVATITGRGPE